MLLHGQSSFLFLLDIVFSVVSPHIHFQLLVGLTCTVVPWLSQTQTIWNRSFCFPTFLNLAPLLAFLQDIHTQHSGFLTFLWPFRIICSSIHLTFHSSSIYSVLYYIPGLFWKHQDVQMGQWSLSLLSLEVSGVDGWKKINIKWKLSWKN